MNLVDRKHGLSVIFALTLVSCGAVAANASNITYNVNRTIGAGSVTGTITTDGATGTLSQADIVDWNLVLFTPVQGSFTLDGPLSGNNSVVYEQGADLTATTTQLLFDFSGGDGGLFAFQQGLFSGNHYYCDGTPGNFACAQGESVVPISVFQSGWINVPQSGNQVIGTAGGSSTPEPGTLALLGSGALAAFGAFRRKMML